MIAMTAMADEWTLVTNAADLQAGDQIVIGYADAGNTAGLTTTSTTSAKFLNPVSSTFGSGTVTPSNTTAIFTLGGQAGAWTLTTQENKLLGAFGLKKVDYDKGTTTWTIAVSDGNATISSTNTDYGKLLYNVQTPRFTTYGDVSSQCKLVQIYRVGSLTPRVAISYQGFPYRKTLCEEPTYKAGSTYTLPTATPTVGGKTLTAWTYDGQTYLPGATFTVPETDVVFVPVWDGGTGIDQTNIRTQAVKILRNGQLVILHNGVEYNAQGIRLQ